MQTVRGAFEYQGQYPRFLYPPSHTVTTGQKCSATSRLYIPDTMWRTSFKDQLVQETKKLKVGPTDDFANFLGPVMLVFSYSVEI
jgi:1-pyrroline-5-carboxylate dehydrogenase